MASTAAAAPGDYLESFGPDGTVATQFSRPAALAVDQETGAVYVADSETQTLYKFGEEGNPLAWGGAAGYLSGNQLTGLALSTEGSGTTQIAVDSETHVVYVTSDNEVTAFEADGEPHSFTEGPGAGTNQMPGATELLGVTVDAFGDIYASDLSAQKVRIYSRSGALITEFEPLNNQLSPLKPANLAVAPDGTLHVLNTGFGPGVYALEPSEFPVTAKTTYGLGQPLQPSASPTSVAVDPVTEYVYVGGNCYAEVCSVSAKAQIAVYDESGELIDYIGTEEPGALTGSIPGLGVNGEGKKLYAAVRKECCGLSQVSVYTAIPFPVGAPTISGPAVTEVTTTSAELRARINPHTLETTYQFEYGTADCTEEPDPCTKVPATPTSIGSGHSPVLVTAQISGLAPGTRYFFRVVAENGFEPAKEPVSNQRSFTTKTETPDTQLGDERVWELVTPSRKFGGVMTNGALVQAAPDGSGIAYNTRGSVVEDPEGNRALEAAAALSRRNPSGTWSTSDLVPRHTEAGGLGFGPEFKMFSEDLGHALLEPRDDTPLSEEASERGPYLRTNTVPPVYRPLVTTKEPFDNVPQGTVFGGEANGARNPVSISGADPSLTHVVISSKAPLIEGAAERSLYEWSDGQIEAVSKLPAGEGGGIVRAELGSGALSVRNAVSEDGSRVFWSPGYPLFPSLEWPALYLRDTVADATYRLDKAKAGATKEGAKAPAFMGASADGSVVFFTDSQQLVKGASPQGRDLYRCVIGPQGEGLGCKTLEDLSAPIEGSGENGEAEELALGISEDGSSAYFIARAVLDPKPNEAGEKAKAGAPNLYLWQEGAGRRLVAPLSEKDAADWGSGPPNPVGQASRGAANASPDGRYLTFMSQEGLAGSETADPATGKPVEQAFLYDSAEDRLLCISCNPSGATDPGHQIVKDTSEGGVIFPDVQQLWGGRLVGATLPETTEGEPNIGYAIYWPRGVLNNGRAYFNSTSALVDGDSNGTWDVYQYEPFGVGDCEPSSGGQMVATTEAGCLSLLSAGTDPEPSVFLDSSKSGDDVFLATFAQLSALDGDTDVDVYDARVNGVKAVVEHAEECSPDEPPAGVPCQLPLPPPPNEAPPSSSTFNGPGNAKPKPNKHCPKSKKKVKRKGKARCVPKKNHHHNKGAHR